MNAETLDPMERMLAERACERLVVEFVHRLDLGDPGSVAELSSRTAPRNGRPATDASRVMTPCASTSETGRQTDCHPVCAPTSWLPCPLRTLPQPPPTSPRTVSRARAARTPRRRRRPPPSRPGRPQWWGDRDLLEGLAPFTSTGSGSRSVECHSMWCMALTAGRRGFALMTRWARRGVPWDWRRRGTGYTW